MKKVFILLLLLCICNISYAKTTTTINKNEGYFPYNGWIIADMSFNNNVITPDASYSMKIYNDFGLIPVGYCASGGSRLGTYVIFFVNPYNDCLIVGKVGSASHSSIFTSTDLKPFELTGSFVYYTDISTYQDFHRKIINTAKEEFANYQNLIKK